MTDTHALPANCSVRIVGADALLHTPFSQPVRLWARQRGGLWEAITKQWVIRHTPTLIDEFRSLCWALWPNGAAVAEPWKGRSGDTRSGQGTPTKYADPRTICIRCQTVTDSPSHHYATIADMRLCELCFRDVVVDVESRGLTFTERVSQGAPAPSAETATEKSNPTENPTTAQNLGTDAKAARRAAMRAALGG
jgi:hypothetical protein